MIATRQELRAMLKPDDRGRRRYREIEVVYHQKGERHQLVDRGGRPFTVVIKPSRQVPA